MGFTINLAKGFKKKPKASKLDIVSKLCIGITVKEGDEYKIKICHINSLPWRSYSWT